MLGSVQDSAVVSWLLLGWYREDGTAEHRSASVYFSLMQCDGLKGSLEGPAAGDNVKHVEFPLPMPSVREKGF